MVTKDPRIDAYIAKSPEFARPILVKLRALVHRGCPEVVETMKWGSPSFEHHGILGGMAAFKAHCVFGFWKGSLVTATAADRAAMGQFGRLQSLSDLPSDRVIVAWIEKAAGLNESGVRVERPRKHPKPAIPLPAELVAAFRARKHARAKAFFESLSPSGRREYLEWITGAKRAETRAQRVAKTLAQLGEGKPHNWKYTQ
jgi:hypothetical protein